MRNAMSSILKAVSFLMGRENVQSRATQAQDRQQSPSLTVVCILTSTADRLLLKDLASRNHWKAIFSSTTEEAHGAVNQTKPQVILIDRDVDGAVWRGAVSSLATASDGACVVLISSVIDEYLWNEVVTNGGYDVLRKPLHEDDVLRNVKLAWSYWSGTRNPAAK